MRKTEILAENYIRLPRELAEKEKKARALACGPGAPGASGKLKSRKGKVKLDLALRNGLDLARRAQNFKVIQTYSGDVVTVRLWTSRRTRNEIQRITDDFAVSRRAVIAAAIHYAGHDYVDNPFAKAG